MKEEGRMGVGEKSGEGGRKGREEGGMEEREK